MYMSVFRKGELEGPEGVPIVSISLYDPKFLDLTSLLKLLS